jgi:hypothetical protein
MNSVRVAILLLGNLYTLNKSQTKTYVKKKSTYQKLLNFFNLERSNMKEDELAELELVLSKMYSTRELFLLTKIQKSAHRKSEKT